MPEVIAHLLKLVEDHDILTCVAQFPGLIEDLLNIALAAGSGDRLAGNCGKPVKTLLAHLSGQDGDRIARKQLRIECAAAAVVTGRRPYGLMICGIKLTRYQSREQTSDGRAYLMATCREPFADHADDLGVNARKLLGKYKEIRLSELSALFLGLIVPCDPEKVQGIDIPESDIL